DVLRTYAEIANKKDTAAPYLALTGIHYDHIPDIYYYYQDNAKALNIDLRTVGKKIGYIDGAGDKVTVALKQMGYDVVTLKEQDITFQVLKQFDAVITGVRAYNVHPYLTDRNNELMEYVKQGGNLIVQYNTNSFAGPMAAKIGPYPFNISRNRVTDQNAKVDFLLPQHPVLNYPNKITGKDFEGWIQERGTYFADQIDPHYQMPLGMNDAGEPKQNGSLIITDYGKGKFVYTGLVFFRELPAGVPGAYRLIANIIALSKKRPF
ncbi:MAG: PIG-L family deacetylase, partial [Flavitalea sp.]